MEQKLKEIMGRVFRVDPKEINESSSIDNVKNWDSLKHANLIMALEQGFNVAFETDEIMDMLNYKIIKLIINEKL